MANGITRVVISVGSAFPPTYRFGIRGKKSDFQVSATEAPVQVFVVLGEAAQADAGLCGKLAFNPSSALRPKCALSKTGARLTCR